MEKAFAKAVIENLLLISNKPLTVNIVKGALNNEFKGSDIKKIFMELICEYSDRNFQLLEVAGGYQLSTRYEYSEWVKKFHKSEKASVLSRASLETLAIIAYKQPITRIEIEGIRGVDSAGTIRNLLEKNLIRIAGKKEVMGRPMMYGTARKFLEYFGLRSLSDLPALKEFSERELGEGTHESDKREKQIPLPLKDPPPEDNIDDRNSLPPQSRGTDPPGHGNTER